MMMKHTHNISRVRAWILAIRLRTVPAAMAPVLVGTAMAIADKGFRFLTALASHFSAHGPVYDPLHLVKCRSSIKSGTRRYSRVESFIQPAAVHWHYTLLIAYRGQMPYTPV